MTEICEFCGKRLDRKEPKNLKERVQDKTGYALDDIIIGSFLLGIGIMFSICAVWFVMAVFIFNTPF